MHIILINFLIYKCILEINRNKLTYLLTINVLLHVFWNA